MLVISEISQENEILFWGTGGDMSLGGFLRILGVKMRFLKFPNMSELFYAMFSVRCITKKTKNINISCNVLNDTAIKKNFCNYYWCEFSHSFCLFLMSLSNFLFFRYQL